MQAENNKEITTFDEHLDRRYGTVGSLKRTEFEIKAKAFAIGEIIRENVYRHFTSWSKFDLENRET